jgi:hypothetical protein
LIEDVIDLFPGNKHLFILTLNGLFFFTFPYYFFYIFFIIIYSN